MLAFHVLTNPPTSWKGSVYDGDLSPVKANTLHFANNSKDVSAILHLFQSILMYVEYIDNINWVC